MEPAIENLPPKGKFAETPHSQDGEASVMPGERPNAGMLEGSQTVSLYIERTNQYINLNSDGWAVVGNDPVTTYVIVPYSDGNYYIVIGNGSFEGDYLSYNNNSYIGAYGSWTNACWWSPNPVNCVAYPGLYPYQSSDTYYMCVNGDKKAPGLVVTVVSK